MLINLLLTAFGRKLLLDEILSLSTAAGDPNGPLALAKDLKPSNSAASLPALIEPA